MASSTTPFVHAVQEEFGSASDLGVSAARLRQSPSGGGAGPGASGAAFPGVTQLAAPFTQQLAGITTDASVRSTQGIVVGQQVFVPGLGFLTALAVPGPTVVSLLNPGGPGQAPAGSIAPAGTLVSLAGTPQAARLGRQLWVAAGVPLGGDGSIQAPFATIGAALAYIAAQGTPDWSVFIEPGTYPEAVTLPIVDRIQLRGAGPGQTIIAPPIGSAQGMIQNALALPPITSLELRDLQVRMVDGAAGLVLNGAAQTAYLAGDGVNLLNVTLTGPASGAPLVLINVQGGRASQTLAGAVTMARAGAVAFSDSTLGDVTLTGSSLGSFAFVTPTSFLGGTSMVSLTAQSDATGPVQVYLDASSFVFGHISFSDAPVDAARSGAYLEVRGDCNQISLASNATGTGFAGLYDLRQMTMGIMGQIAGSFTANMLDGAPVDARESDLASATFALTGPFLLDLRGATYSQTNLIGGAGPGVTVDRNVIALPPVTVAASPAAPIAVLITPPLPVALYSVPQPELTSGPGGFLQITGKTGAQFLVASTGGAGVYNALVLRRP